MTKSGKLYSLLLIFFVFMQSVLLSQSIPNNNWKTFSYDVFGNVYLSDGEQIVKINSDNKVSATYEDGFLGEIANVDSYSGLNILVYHSDANSLVLLNNNLTTIGKPINLNERNLFDLQCAFLGENDKIWVVDGQSFQLLEIDKNGNIVVQASYVGNFTSASKIEKCWFRNNSIYLITNLGELLLFDKFGVFVQKITLGEVLSPIISKEDLIFIQNKNVLQLNVKTFTLDTIKNNLSKNVNAIFYLKNQFYVFKSNKLEPLNY